MRSSGDRAVVVVLGVDQDRAEVGVGLGVVGPEPDGGADLGGRLRQLPRGGQGEGEAGMGIGVVGAEADGPTQDRDPLGRGRQRTGAIASFPQQFTVMGVVAAIVGTPSQQVLEHRERLVRVPGVFQRDGQGQHRLGPEGAGDGIVADRLLATRPALQDASQVVVEPNVLREPPPAGPQHVVRRLRLPGFREGRAQEIQVNRGQGLQLRGRGDGPEHLAPRCPVGQVERRRSPTRQGAGSTAFATSASRSAPA